jgi:hypothetical protein
MPGFKALQSKVVLFFSCIVLGLYCLLAMAGCSNSGGSGNLVGPGANLTSTPTPISNMIWKNGNQGYWIGGYSMNNTFSPAAAVQYLPVTDTVTGDTTALALVSAGNIPSGTSFTFSFQNSVTQDASAFLNGHVQFDIELALPPSEFICCPGSLSVGVTNVSPALGASYTLIPATLSQTSFTHESISIPGIFGANISSVKYIDQPFEINAVVNMNLATGQPILYLNDIKWVAN